MTAVVISQQLLRDLLILSAQEERARERDTGLVSIRGKRDGERERDRKEEDCEKEKMPCTGCSVHIKPVISNQLSITPLNLIIVLFSYQFFT